MEERQEGRGAAGGVEDGERINGSIRGEGRMTRGEGGRG